MSGVSKGVDTPDASEDSVGEVNGVWAERAGSNIRKEPEVDREVEVWSKMWKTMAPDRVPEGCRALNLAALAT